MVVFMVKKRIAEYLGRYMKKKSFPKLFLNLVMGLSLLIFALSFIFFICYDCYGTYDFLTDAKELAYSAVATASIGICGYYCFLNFKKPGT